MPQSGKLASERFGLKRLSNWGRWGADDEKGTCNFITEAVIRAAAREVQRGVVFSCSVKFDHEAPIHPARPPVQRLMSALNVHGHTLGMPTEAIFNDDVLHMNVQAATQWDGLTHVGYDDSFYNGVRLEQVTSMQGATRNSMHQLGASLSTRGLLVDLVASLGRENAGQLEPGYAVTAADLEACVARQKSPPKSGDALLVRTGWTEHWYRHPEARGHDYFGKQPGLGVDTLEWLNDHEIACVAADNTAVEVVPSQFPGEQFPFHMVALRDLGLTMGEVFDFGALAADCRQDGRYTCFFVGPPLVLVGAVGSPLNPLAFK